MRNQVEKWNIKLLLESILQFIKFGLVGAINTLISLAIYYIMIAIKIDYIFAIIIGYIGSSIIGFYLNRIWVFNANPIKVSNSLVKYYVVYGTSFCLNIGCMFLCVDVLLISEIASPLLTLCITVPYNYLLSKYWAFR